MYKQDGQRTQSALVACRFAALTAYTHESTTCSLQYCSTSLLQYSSDFSKYPLVGTFSCLSRAQSFPSGLDPGWH